MTFLRNLYRFGMNRSFHTYSHFEPHPPKGNGKYVILAAIGYTFSIKYCYDNKK